MVQTYEQWLGSVVAEQVRAALDPVLTSLQEQIMSLKDEIAKTGTLATQALAKIASGEAQVADLTGQVTTLTAANADLQTQLTAALANAIDPADEVALAAINSSLDAVLNPAPPAPEPAPVDPTTVAPPEEPISIAAPAEGPAPADQPAPADPNAPAPTDAPANP